MIPEEVEKQTKETISTIKIEKIEEIIPAESKQYISTYEHINVSTYEVVAGDCLWNIAKKEDIYNDPLEWMRIFQANKDTVKSANLIYPGQLLVIPRDILSKLK